MTTEMDASASPPPPRHPQNAHPTAKAFFEALDKNHNQRRQEQVLESKQSTKLQQRTRSLGWRNRYSQNDQYPISMILNTDKDSLATLQFTVQQIQRGEVEGTYGTGATVWPAAMVLLKYLERQAHLVRGKRVVDLGSGTGVTSIAAAILGADHVVCTDGEDSVVRLARENIQQAVSQLIESNNSSHKQCPMSTSPETSVSIYQQCPIVTQMYWWGTQPLPDEHCDVVLVADCVLPKLYPIAPLVEAIDELLQPDSVAILSYEHRYYPDYDPRDKFQSLARDRGLQVISIEQDQMDPIYCVDDIEIWHVTRTKQM